MSTKMSDMYTETSILDLPFEMLEKILLYLSLDDRRPALQVCRRWSTVIPLSSVQLVVDFKRNRGQEAIYHRTLLASSRQYKHLVLYFGRDSDMFELMVEILQHFSRKMETLKIMTFRVPVNQMLITQLLSLCSNLRYLDIGSCKIEFDPHDLEISPMHKLDELYLGKTLLPNMINIMPNLTRLHMSIYDYSEEAQMFLRHCSSQLVELKIWFWSMRYFSMVCNTQFPLLEKLTFICAIFDIVSGVSFNEVEMFDLFFPQLPLLKEVTIRHDLDNQVIPILCRSCMNIQFLYVNTDFFSQDSFRAICELKHLKHLTIEQSIVDVPPDMYSPQKSLRKLTLYFTRIGHKAMFNSFVQRAFPNLAVMELLHFRPRSIEMHGQICSNIPSLQRLVVSESGLIMTLGQFLQFCASHSPKELRLKCRTILDFPNDNPSYRISVQKLVLDSPRISHIVLQKLISSMEELRWLEIVVTNNLPFEVIGSLREQFPRCYVVAKRTVVIEEPL